MDGAMPRWATWQSRQFGSSCPAAWECGTTCSRKNRETRASEKATQVASRRFRRASADPTVQPVFKNDLSGSRGSTRLMHSLLSTKRIAARTKLYPCPRGIDAVGEQKDGFLRKIYWEKALGLAARSAVKLAAIWAQILRTSSSVGFLSSSYFASGM